MKLIKFIFLYLSLAGALVGCTQAFDTLTSGALDKNRGQNLPTTTSTITSSTTPGSTSTNPSSTSTTGPLTTTTTLTSSTTTLAINHPTPWRMQVLQGDGVIALTQWQFGEPFEVKVLDANDQPVPNIQVSWSCDSANAARLPTAQTTTGADGSTSVRAYADGVDLTQGYSQSIVTAQVISPAGGVSARFHASSMQKDTAGTDRPFYRVLIPDSLSGYLDIQANSIMRSAIQLGYSQSTGPFIGSGIANLGLRVWVEPFNVGDPIVTAHCLTDTDTSTTPLSNSSGIVTCDLSAGATKGSASLHIKAFGSQEWTMILRVQ